MLDFNFLILTTYTCTIKKKQKKKTKTKKLSHRPAAYSLPGYLTPVLAEFLLRLLKGGNKFAMAGGGHLVNVSQGLMETWWSLKFKPRVISFLQVINFQCDIICWMFFLHYLWKGNSQNKDKVFQNMIVMIFERDFNYFGHFFFMIAGIIYMNRW